MSKPTKLELDEIRLAGFRPEVVACFLCDKKILFLYNKDYDLWQLPQGGIDNGETTDSAFIREMTEELGKTFLSQCYTDLTFIGEDKILLPPSAQFSRELETDDGQIIMMSGKKYFFLSSQSQSLEINIEETEFADYKWLDYSEAFQLMSQNTQKGKARIIIKVLKLLRSLDLLK
ncbi:MAG: NUDIX domain-containing protein [Planctomycetes bacterium]|jgi:putative (di)nucleoside polyphosphate hydrolase|nr:NUDIX domain-containing protein [Planctomycetota bacterium]